MPMLQPIAEGDAADKVAQTYERIREMFGGGPIPEPFLVYANVPAFLGDFYMNFKKFVYNEGALSPLHKATVGLAVASYHKCGVWIDYFTARILELGGGESHSTDVLAVTATCQMYNAFFKFRDLSGSDRYSGMSVGLRAHTFASTSLDEPTVELINVAISDLNGCKPCTSGHIDKARALGLSDEALLEAIQCASTMTAGCGFWNSTHAVS